MIESDWVGASNVTWNSAAKFSATQDAVLVSITLCYLSYLKLSNYEFLINKMSENKIILILRKKANFLSQYIAGFLNINSPVATKLGNNNV